MILLILLAGTVLRLLNINQSLWLDEAISINFSSKLSYLDLITKYSLGDFHPPLYYLVLKTWIIFFGNSEAISRIPSVFFGVGTIWITYLLAKRMFDEKTGLIAATLLATAPLHIYYSQEARMYSMAAFFTILAVYFFVNILREDKIVFWVGLILSAALMFLSNYMTYLLMPAFIIYLLIFRKKIRKPTLYSFIPALILTLILIVPWFFILVRQLEVGVAATQVSPAWANVVGSSEIKDFLLAFVKFTIGRISVTNNVYYALLFAPVGIFVSSLFVISLFRTSNQRSFLYFWFFCPVIFGFILSFFVPVFSYFRFIFILPAFYIIWAAAINTVNWTLPTRFLLLTALLVNLTCSAIYILNPSFHRENWKDAVNYVDKDKTSSTLVLFESNATVEPFNYYNRDKVKAIGGLDSWNPKPEKVQEILDNNTQNIEKIYLFQYLSQITDKEGLLFQKITEKGFFNTETKDFRGVGFVYEFKRI